MISLFVLTVRKPVKTNLDGGCLLCMCDDDQRKCFVITKNSRPLKTNCCCCWKGILEQYSFSNEKETERNQTRITSQICERHFRKAKQNFTEDYTPSSSLIRVNFFTKKTFHNFFFISHLDFLLEPFLISDWCMKSNYYSILSIFKRPLLHEQECDTILKKSHEK